MLEFLLYPKSVAGMGASRPTASAAITISRLNVTQIEFSSSA